MEKEQDDLRKLTVDTSLPVEKRLSEYLSRTADPYRFRVGGVAVSVEFRGSTSLSDLLVRLLNAG